LFDEKLKKPYLFISILISVVAAETLIFLYTRLETPSLKPAHEEKKVFLKLSSVKPAPKPEPVCHCQEPPKPKPEEVKPKPKPIEKPKQKPVIKPKPKPKPLKKPKPTPKKMEKPVKKYVEKRVIDPVRKSLPPPPAPKPVVAAQSVDKEKIDRIKAEYLASVRRKIEENKYYPRSAKRLRQTGVVEVKFTILKNGRIAALEVIGPCKYGRLNNAAKKTLEKIGKFDPIPEGIDSEEFRLKIPIKYMLKN